MQTPTPGLTAALCALLAGLAGCTADNPPDAARGTARGTMQAQPDRSAYLGWRLFQANCARCHGPDASGTASAPDLLPRVRAMSEERFVHTVLNRYQWVLPSAEATAEGAARDALVRDILSGARGGTQMPAWEGEPAVRVHIRDLYGYLDGRAQGRLGPGRPQVQ